MLNVHLRMNVIKQFRRVNKGQNLQLPTCLQDPHASRVQKLSSASGQVYSGFIVQCERFNTAQPISSRICFGHSDQ